jgi:hypothetical protein
LIGSQSHLGDFNKVKKVWAQMILGRYNSNVMWTQVRIGMEKKDGDRQHFEHSLLE